MPDVLLVGRVDDSAGGWQDTTRRVPFHRANAHRSARAPRHKRDRDPLGVDQGNRFLPGAPGEIGGRIVSTTATMSSASSTLESIGKAIRALECAVHELTGHAEILGDKLRQLRMERSVLSQTDEFMAVIAAAANAFGVAPDDILGKTRPDSVCLARHAAMAICHGTLRYSFRKTGMRFDRDHGAVISGIENIHNRCAQSKEVAQMMERARLAVSHLTASDSKSENETTPTSHA